MMGVLQKHSWRRMVHNAKVLLGQTPLAVGVDWGSCMIKTVALQADRHGLTLRDFSIQPVAGRFFRNEQSDADLVEGLQKKVSFSFSTLGTALSGPSVLVKPITLPVMTEDDIRDHLTLELDRYIALDAQDVYWDVYHRDVLPPGRNDQQEHFLSVGKKECVERQVEAFSQCGVTVGFVDVDVFALSNLVAYSYGKEGTWLLAHIGPTGIVMVVIVCGEPAYIHKVAFEVEWYGDLLDQVLSPQISLEPKKELGASERCLLEKFFEETQEKICETLGNISDHTKIVIDRGILISGGYSVVPDMVETLSPSLDVPVHLVEPFQGIMIPHAIQQDPVFQQVAPLMSVAVGVALRGALSHD